MRFSVIYLGLPLLAQLVSAAPYLPTNALASRSSVVKKAAYTDAANTGFATQNGGYVVNQENQDSTDRMKEQQAELEEQP